MRQEGNPKLSETLETFCEEHLGPLTHVSFCGWAHAESNVWRVVSESQTAYLKAHRQPRKYRQELNAYMWWAPQLTGTPTLLGKLEGNINVLLLSEVPGDLVENLSLDSSSLCDLYRQAGAFLRRLHDLPFEDTDIPLSEALEQRLEGWTGARARGIVEPDDLDWARARVTETLPLLNPYRRVPCHRDFTGRNWLSNDGQLYVIDFEHARADLWFLDLERLTGKWGAEPELEESFFAGYGRTLNDEERGVLERLAALSAVSTIVWAREHGDLTFEAYGRERLANLKRNSHNT